MSTNPTMTLDLEDLEALRLLDPNDLEVSEAQSYELPRASLMPQCGGTSCDPGASCCEFSM
ncbi:hypothetical protein EV651_110303 [Kribbella sp. VKM Ac-2571]|uniref:hypothetical protein n=1 Tax=Kribbella sp. VKM Ac-2571 TaxID=2512222 RepID=UPI00105D560A|nr:hypothetical protein [Kribbella sp. VKM Ac-2571]TDO58267.1 hypothetical protein EV651_110303 [Kribbella sp. VKM Ac-2571]